MDTTLVKLEHRLLAWATLALIIAVALKNWYLCRQVRKLQSTLRLQPAPRRFLL